MKPTAALNHDHRYSDGLERIDVQRDHPAWRALPPGADTSAGDAPPTRCPQCDGAGWLGSAVPYGHPQFGVLIPCACLEEARARRRAAYLRQLSNLDAFQDKTFATLTPFVAGLRAIVPQVLAYAQQPDGWLSLFGSYGVGKTHLAAAIAHEALARGMAVLFIVTPDLLDHLRAAFSPQSDTSYDERFELVRSVSLLVLDDLGTESATPWAREKLYQLLNHRYNLRLPTVITTNLRPDALDPRIYSRMCDPACGRIITIAAGDYRRRGQ